MRNDVLEFLGLAVLLSTVGGVGCASPPPVARLTLVTTRGSLPPASIVAADVEGYHCYWRTILDDLTRFPWNQRLANHAFALQAVMQRYPDANVMLDASVWAERASLLVADRYCVFVRGDVGRLE